MSSIVKAIAFVAGIMLGVRISAALGSWSNMEAAPTTGTSEVSKGA